MFTKTLSSVLPVTHISISSLGVWPHSASYRYISNWDVKGVHYDIINSLHFWYTALRVISRIILCWGKQMYHVLSRQKCWMRLVFTRIVFNLVCCYFYLQASDNTWTTFTTSSNSAFTLTGMWYLNISILLRQVLLPTSILWIYLVK